MDSKGNVRKAVAYGKDSGNLNTWFHFEDVKKALGPWVLPETPYWYNNKRWIRKLRNEHVPKKEASSNNNNQPSGFWPHPHKENFVKKRAPWKLKKKLQEKKFIFDCEENSIVYTGYTGYNEIPVSNKFDVLSDRDQMNNLNHVHTETVLHTENKKHKIHTPHKKTQVRPRRLFKNSTIHSDTSLHTEINSSRYNYQAPSLHTETILHTENLPSLHTETNLHTENENNSMNTPCKRTHVRPRRLFDMSIPNTDISKIDIDIVPEEINLEVLLLNSLIINTTKVQTVVENFIRNKEYNSIFCLTETKVDSLDFEPQGIKMFSKHRNKKEKKGGGLSIGFKKDTRIRLEEIKIKNNYVLALEGTIRNTKIRIILSYF